MDESKPWRNLGVVGLRLVDLVVRYAATFAVTWLAVEASLSGEFSVIDEWPAFAVIIGVPSVLISFVYGLCSTRTGAEFRGPLALLLLLPLWFLLFFSPILPIPLVGQLVFALCVMRAPMLGPPQLRPLGRAAAACLARRMGRRARRAAP
ncbi:hypothetical protein ABZ532_19690 [Streptomyces sp. NPDC019396]|uniref:hypothetical protein n=1 Tax=Streptomyces sp. NPDC019396 TaxID=3154687 RepID=UPI0033DDFFD5